MITIRRAIDRGHFEHGWLDTYHTFSFGDYMSREHHHSDLVIPGTQGNRTELRTASLSRGRAEGSASTGGLA